MQAPAFILRSRHRRAIPPTASCLSLGCSTTFSLGLVLIILLSTLVYTDLTRDLPPVETLAALLEPPDGILLQPSKLYDRSGTHILTLLNLATQHRQYLHISPTELIQPGDEGILTQNLVDTTLAASDPDFWSHPGFPIPGLHKTSQVTLAQRLVSDLLISGEPASLRTDLRQRLLAAQITAYYGRSKVLEYYLNSAYYGHMAYGIDAAARLYFNKPATQLNLAEAATLAAVVEAPNLNPFDAPQEALARQKIVIQNMLHNRMILPEEGIQAARADLTFHSTFSEAWAYDLTGLGQYPAFLEMLFQQIETEIPRRQVERGGLHIYTTLDRDLQTQAVCALQIQQARLTGQSLPESAASCPAALLLPTLNITASLPASLTADLLILDPATGQVLVLVGTPPIDLGGSILPAHPAGSLSTSFIYLTAFTRGLSPASLVWDIPSSGALSQDIVSQYHGPMRLRIAAVNDYLNPAQSIMALVGIENIWRTARQFGLYSGNTPSVTGSPSVDTLLEEVNLISVGQAFGILANQGLLVGKTLEMNTTRADSGQPTKLDPITVLRVDEAGSGRVLLDWNTVQSRPILTAQLAYLMTDVLSDEPARWASLGHPNPLEIGRPTAARLAINASGASNWAIGYTPQRVTGVWLGLNPTIDLPLSSVQLFSQATAGLWHAMMQYASRDLPSQSWSVPSGISHITVCDTSGMLPTRYCPNLVEEVFISGSEPVQTDTLYQAIAVNRQTERLATVFTPPDLIEPRIFFIAPSEAQEWASQAGLETPPQVYDTIPLDTPEWPEAAILSPQMFSILRDQVDIRGSAGGDNFSFFRLEIGRGIYPQRWLQIGGEVHTPSRNGLLAIWDTTGLDGLYAIRLLVVESDQTLRSSTVLVTIDNTPPDVRINYPTPGQQISLDRKRIIFQVDVSDEIGLQNVTFLIDGIPVKSFVQPPYAIGWQVSTGAHILQVVAIDQAGNASEASLEFSVK